MRLCGMRYKVEPHLPADVLEDVWVDVALGEEEEARKTIDALPKSHPFEIRYLGVEKIDWESCRNVLDQREKERILKKQW